MNFTDNQFAIEKLLMLPDKVAGKKIRALTSKAYIFSVETMMTTVIKLEWLGA